MLLETKYNDLVNKEQAWKRDEDTVKRQPILRDKKLKSWLKNWIT